MEAFEFFIPQNIMVGAGTMAKTFRKCAKKTGWFPCHADFRPYTAKNGNCGQSG